MPGPNGKVAIDAAIASIHDDILDLGDLEPKTRPVRVKRDGQTVELPGWFDGDGCPVPIHIAIAAARKAYRERVYYGTSEQLSGEDTDGPYLDLCLKMIGIVVPGLTPAERETMAGNRTRRDALLAYLEWIPKPVLIEVRLRAAEGAMGALMELVATSEALTGRLGDLVGVVSTDTLDLVNRLMMAAAVGDEALTQWRSARDAMEAPTDPEVVGGVEPTTAALSPGSATSTSSLVASS